MVIIIDYGLGNLGSIKNMLNKIGVNAEISGDPVVISSATKLILPGVGAFDNGMQNLTDLKLIEVLNKKVLEDKVPVLGICLAMQLMTRGSEEGNLLGLGWVDAVTIKFNSTDSERKFPIPHMGWEYVKAEKESLLLKEMYDKPRFYFVHSYYVKALRGDDVLISTDYNGEFVSGFEKNNILGVQFHPEKSHKFGMKLFKNFIENY